MLTRTLFLTAALSGAALPLSAQLSAAITSDPTTDIAQPAALESFQIPSHGAGLNAMMYIAPGAGAHPIVILLHGFPGNEKNLDLAQTMRRAGWDVLYFNYRGSWGTSSQFSFSHCMEDAQAALAYVRQEANAHRLHADPRTIVLVGHSMGGMVAAYVGAHDPQVKGITLISAADMAGRTKLPPSISAEARKTVQEKVASALAREGLAPLAGCTPDALAAELLLHADSWSLAAQGALLKDRQVLVVTSDDGNTAANDAFTSAVRSGGNAGVSAIHLATDHVYSGKRIQLEETVLRWLDSVKESEDLERDNKK